MEQSMSSKKHTIVIEERKSVSITGIKDVVAFDEKQVILDTSKGLLTFKGKNLSVNSLSIEKGELDIKGEVDSIVYSAIKTTDKSWSKRLFG